MRKFLTFLGLCVAGATYNVSAQCPLENTTDWEMRIVDAHTAPTTDFIVQIRYLTTNNDCGCTPSCANSTCTSVLPTGAEALNNLNFGIKWDSAAAPGTTFTVQSFASASTGNSSGIAAPYTPALVLGNATPFTNGSGTMYQDFADNAAAASVNLGTWTDGQWYNLMRITPSAPLPVGVYPQVVDVFDPMIYDPIYGNGVTPTIYQSDLGCPLSAKVSYVLSVDLKEFTGVKEGNTSLLNWVTVSEENMSHYIVERSNDGVVFDKEIGTVASKAIGGNSNSTLNYNLIDKTPKAGHNYYRLKSFELNGKVSYSNVVDLYFNEGSAVSVYPNPATDNLNVEIDALSSTQASVKIMDVAGKIVKAVDYKLEKGSNINPISLEGLAAGSYFIKITDGKSINFSQQIQKL